MLKRAIYSEFLFSVTHFPVTGLIGPRQVGKSTFAKSFAYNMPLVYLDLEKDSDLNKLNDPELFFTSIPDHTIVLDEIQHKPALFPLIRSLVDERRIPGRFVILGSASPELLKQSSESLAGRINYLEMFPLNLLEVEERISLADLWLQGGFPEPALNESNKYKQAWYGSFIQSYIYRDLPSLGLSANPNTIRQLLMMLASLNGATLNYSMLAKSLGISMPTVKTYLGYFVNAFLVTELSPWHVNVKKRLVKSPKIYFRDTGMLHYLLGIKTMEGLYGNISVGNSWEAFVIHQVKSALLPDDGIYYYRTQDGAEIDLLIRRENRWFAAAEIKLSLSPKLTKGTYIAMKDLEIDQLYIITPGVDKYAYDSKAQVIGIQGFLKKLTA
ncbi:MAG: ATP-binding protein [Cyclobacterium sp.]|uniref:ATP-binding protein n=1 Tax=Cyclobacterium sp. TaxID=1966343 RepID=UPI003970EF61